MPTEEALNLGAEAMQVERPQAYLEKFGYLDSPVLDEFGVRSVLTPVPVTTRGTFDDETARALRGFQEFNRLPVTGVLDEATINLYREEGGPTEAD